MTLIRLSRSAVALCLTLLGLGCLAEQNTASLLSPQAPPRDVVSGDWVFHIGGGTWVSSITLATISPAGDSLTGWRGTEAPSRQWDGSAAPALGLADAVGIPLNTSGGVEWRWQCPSGERCRMRYQVVADTARGELFMNDSLGFEQGYPMFGVRVRADVFALAFGAERLTVMSDSTPTVLLWLADDPPQDEDFIARLRSRGLTAMLAIPTHFVGRNGRPGWQELRNDQALGFGIAAHSRTHSATTADGPDFVGEVLGSIADLDSMGFAPTTFVEPGNWPEAIAFDSVSKFTTWRAAMVRTFVWVFASRVGPGTRPEPLTTSTAFGIGHWTVSDGLPDSVIHSLWRQANQRGHFTAFGIHTWKLRSPGALDWFLDSLSLAQNTGRVRVIADIVLSSPALRSVKGTR
ncbi:MAG: hypothetical protein E6J42_05700 [Chloroflexi bacterium]|nr:MAG: hypothetical protein E6J42_05700 [Chloroflexota bacterium]